MRDQAAVKEKAARVREIYHEQKMRQQVRENSQELRELESKLRTAYVTKGLIAQKQKREAMMLADELQKKQEFKDMEAARLLHLEQLKKNHEIEQRRKKQLHQDLTEQIVTAHMQHQKLYEEFLREKYYLDEIAQRVQDELLEQAQQKIERKEKTKKEMEAFKIIKRDLEKTKEIETREENQRILEYCQQRDKKIAEDEKRERELEMNRKNLNEKMVAELSELTVSLEAFYFVSESHEESVNVLAVRQTLSKTFEHHWIFQDCRAKVLKSNDSVLVVIHFLDNYVDQIFHCFINVFILMLVDKLF